MKCTGKTATGEKCNARAIKANGVWNTEKTKHFCIHDENVEEKLQFQDKLKDYAKTGLGSIEDCYTKASIRFKEKIHFILFVLSNFTI